VIPSARLRDLAVPAVVVRLNEEEAPADRFYEKGGGLFERSAGLSVPNIAG